MSSKAFQFSVIGKEAPLLEINDAGIYVRFQAGVSVEKTFIRSEWPHVAVDLAADGSVVGIEYVPAPDKFTIGLIAEQAGVFVPHRVLQNEPEIQARTASSVLA